MHRQREAIRVIVLLATVLLAGAGSTSTQEATETQGRLSFRVRVSETGLQGRYLAQGKKLTDTVETTLPGRLFDPPFRVAPTGRRAAQWDTPIHAAAADFSAFKSDDRNWILENFIPEERSAVLSFLNDPALHEKNRKVFEGRMERYITGEATYKEHALVFVRDSGQNSSLPFTFKHTPTGWKRTNQLAADEILDIVFSALANGGEVTVQP
jgi:hypothetical protein